MSEGEKKGQIPASDTFKDEHNDMGHLSEKQTWIVLILRWGVRGPFQQNKSKTKINMRISSLKQKKKTNNRGFRGGGNQRWRCKTWKQQIFKTSVSGSQVSEESSCCHIPSPRPNTAKCVSSFGYTVVSRCSVSQRRRVAIVSRGFTFVASVLNLVRLPCCTHQPPNIPLCQFFFLRVTKNNAVKRKSKNN